MRTFISILACSWFIGIFHPANPTTELALAPARNGLLASPNWQPSPTGDCEGTVVSSEKSHTVTACGVSIDAVIERVVQIIQDFKSKVWADVEAQCKPLYCNANGRCEAQNAVPQVTVLAQNIPGCWQYKITVKLTTTCGC